MLGLDSWASLVCVMMSSVDLDAEWAVLVTRDTGAGRDKQLAIAWSVECKDKGSEQQPFTVCAKTPLHSQVPTNPWAGAASNTTECNRD